jgi:hypothetical protein
MPIEVLTKLQYAETGTGPWRLYIYGLGGLHNGAQWFAREPLRYPDEEITIAHAKSRVDKAIALGREIRVTNAGDLLVFRSRGGNTLYGENFWKEIQ